MNTNLDEKTVYLQRSNRKNMNISLLIHYLLAINLITFFIYGIDKYKAKKSKWRISEKTLIFMAIIGGSVGALMGIHSFHHKTMHKKFKYGVPLILLCQIAIFVYLKLHLQ